MRRLPMAIMGLCLAFAPKVAFSESPAPSAQIKGFDTPTKSVKTYLKASLKGDIEKLKHCFHVDAPGEFEIYTTGDWSDRDLAKLKKFVKRAKVTDEVVDGDTAVVYVKFASRDEQLLMQRTDVHGWQILDF